MNAVIINSPLTHQSEEALLLHHTALPRGKHSHVVTLPLASGPKVSTRVTRTQLNVIQNYLVKTTAFLDHSGRDFPGAAKASAAHGRGTAGWKASGRCVEPEVLLHGSFLQLARGRDAETTVKTTLSHERSATFNTTVLIGAVYSSPVPYVGSDGRCYKRGRQFNQRLPQPPLASPALLSTTFPAKKESV